MELDKNSTPGARNQFVGTGWIICLGRNPLMRREVISHEFQEATPLGAEYVVAYSACCLQLPLRFFDHSVLDTGLDARRFCVGECWPSDRRISANDL